MAVVMLAAGAGALGMMGAVMGQKQEDQQILDAARQEGVSHAGIEFGAERRASFLVQQASLITEGAQQESVLIDKAQARAESDAKVSAAQAGVTGASIDATINDTKRTAAEAKGSISKRIQAQSLQLTTDYVDNYLNAEMSKTQTEYRTKSSSTRFLEAGLSFGSGFLGAYSPGT